MVQLQTLLSNSNRIFRPIGFQIKRVYDLVTKGYYYALFNEINDSLSHKNTWSAKESAFYFAILDEIISAFLESDEDDIHPDAIDFSFISIGSTAAVNLARRAGVSMVLGEKLLKKWIAEHWFEKIRSDRVTIGIRTMTLMSSYLNSKFSIFNCYTCNSACLIGISCPKCNLCMHYHCLEGSVHGHPCPTCNVPMSKVKTLLPPTREQPQEEEDEEQAMEQDDSD